MFPISSKRRLSFIEIADRWSQEMAPSARPLDIFNALGRAWWLGELVAASGPSRADVLRCLYAQYSHCIAFAPSDSLEPPIGRKLPNGSLEVTQLWRVPLPNSQPKSWDDTNCTAAFKAVAEAWTDLSRLDSAEHVAEPVVGGLEVTEAEFTRWVVAEGYPRPGFWLSGKKESQATVPSQKLTETHAASLAEEYIQSTKRKGGRPTQLGFDKWVHDKKVIGSRDILREAYKKAADRAGIPVRRGRYPNQD
jgi:hypothetical protein